MDITQDHYKIIKQAWFGTRTDPISLARQGDRDLPDHPLLMPELDRRVKSLLGERASH